MRDSAAAAGAGGEADEAAVVADCVAAGAGVDSAVARLPAGFPVGVGLLHGREAVPVAGALRVAAE